MNKLSTKSSTSKAIISVAFCLLPLLIGLLLYSRLPEEIPVHFNFAGVPDSWWPRWKDITIIPLILTILDAIVLYGTLRDPQQNNITRPAMEFLYWLIPGMGLVIMSILYLYALQVPFQMDRLMCALLGLLLIFLGNILPKAKQNSVFGIRTSWSLQDPENWIQSNRFASRLFILGGLISILLAMFVSSQVLSIVLCFIIFGGAAIAPIFYSWWYARKHAS